MILEKRISISLLLLRLGVFVVMFMWTLDKFINPEHATRVFEKYYLIGNLTHEIAWGIGVVQMIIIFGFVLGAYKKWTYGCVLVMHIVSTLSAWQMYMDPWGPKNLLFFAAWPMLAAIIALYLLRDADKTLSIQ